MSRTRSWKTIEGRRNACETCGGLFLCSGFILIFLAFIGLMMRELFKSTTWYLVLYLAFTVIIFTWLPLAIFQRTINTIVSRGMRVFTGKSSRSLQDILLTIDTEVQTEEEFREAEHKAIQCLDALKTELEHKVTPLTTFECILAGSVAERYGIPYAYMKSKKQTFISALKTDFDIMLCFQSIEASFDGRTGILIEPLIPKDIGFLGFAHLKSLTTDSVVSSKDVIQQAECAAANMKIANLGLLGNICWTKSSIEITPPAIKIGLYLKYEADITLCIKCCEWPTLSDWPTRQRSWPSAEDVRRIVSLGCHLVPKPAPSDKEQTSWRFSFSLAEVELSKLVPKTAMKCFLAMKVILKYHLNFLRSTNITSYHFKTILLNTLERTPTNLWVDENIEQCFFILWKAIYDASLHGSLLHHWFHDINLFGGVYTPSAALIEEVQIIGKNPAPFIFDDGCCCLSLRCSIPRLYDFPGHDSNDEVVQIEYVTDEKVDTEPVNEQVDERTDQVAS